MWKVILKESFDLKIIKFVNCELFLFIFLFRKDLDRWDSIVKGRSGGFRIIMSSDYLCLEFYIGVNLLFEVCVM